MRIGFLEPHLERVGGIRRIIEFANRLVRRGNEVTLYVPPGAPLRCDWLTCSARITSIPDGYDEALDVLIFNHEPQWYLLRRFKRARFRAFYALHYAKLYRKPGSWHALRADLDLVLANSSWTADMIEREMGARPPIVLGGLSHELFYPMRVEKEYPLLCIGDTRPWKGTATIEEAARLLGLPLERLAPKDLPQREMAREYAKAETFVVGSRVEGFGWPGLEALACGVPLVTTDNGGSAEYAIDRETALVVPPDDPAAMAGAIALLRSDHELADRLAANGLALVREKFDWERETSKFEDLLRSLVHASTAEQPVWRPAGARERLAFVAGSLEVRLRAWLQR